MNNPPKSHHYLPRHHLSRFSPNRGKPQVAVYDKQTSHTFTVSVVKTACENHLYTVSTGTDPVKKDSATVENTLGVIDSNGAHCLNSIESIEDIASDKQLNFIVYIASLILRTPYSIQRNIDMIQPIMQESFERALKFDRNLKDNLMGKLSFNEEEYQKLVEEYTSGSMTVIPNREAAMLINLQNIPKIAATLAKYSWVYLTCPDGTEFIACDNPAFICDPRTNQTENVGLAHPSGELTIPISKNICAVGKLSNSFTQEFRNASETEVNEINRRTAIAANRFIYSSEYSEEINKLASDMVGSCPVSKTEDLRTPNGSLVKVASVHYPVSGFKPLL